MDNIKITKELTFKIKGIRYQPERPAPFCRNPDNPAYSDPGDPEEMEFSSASLVTVNCDGIEEEVELEEGNVRGILDFLYGVLFEEVLKEMREK